MYTGLLHLHSSFRYLVLAVLLITVIRCLYGWLAQQNFTRRDNILGIALLSLVHLQFLIGLILYFVSPIVKAAHSDMAAAMKDPLIRYWAVEHITIMLFSVILITIGRVMSKKAQTDKSKFKKAFFFYLFGLITMMAGIPWLER